MSNKTELEAIFSSLNGSRRVLHLYSSKVDKYIIHKTFLSQGNGKPIYLTNEDPKIVRKKLSKPQLLVTQTKEAYKIPKYKTVIIDGASIKEEDKFTEYQKHRSLGQSILCTYDISKLSSEKIRELVEQHDKLILTTDNTTVISAKSFSKKDLTDNGMIDDFVKKELKTIVLALLIQKPMCGTDIKRKIFEKFDILLSSGTLYPLLHDLEEKNLLICHNGIKTKTYTPVDKKKVEDILNEHIEAKNFLTSFLQNSLSGG